MSQEVKLADLLNLEKIENTLFRGESWDLGFRALFGGQVMSQALAAAQKTVAKAQVCHSFHSYFLLPGDANLPVVYDVEVIRDGRSFATRRVKAIQHGKSIFYMTASFQFEQEGFTHQSANIADVPKPEDVEADLSYFDRNLEELSSRMQEALSYHRPLDIRTVGAADPFEPKTREPKRYIWMRAHEALTQLSLNQTVLAYASDYHFLATALQPHGITVRDRNLRMATIDHAMWFHCPFHFDDWLLYCTESPFSGGGRALVRGQFFDRRGHLVASTMQEGVVRKREDKS